MKTNAIEAPVLNEFRIIIKNSGQSALASNFENYRRFLLLIKKYPDLKAVPTKAIDEVWHYHLKHKELYHKDCVLNFGYVVGHKPAKKEEDFSALERNYKRTNEMWRLNFNIVLGGIEEMAFCGVDGDGGGNDGDD